MFDIQVCGRRVGYLMLSIPSGWCEIGGSWNIMLARWCVFLYTMLILECWWRCSSVGIVDHECDDGIYCSSA